ncbi:MAG: hypothetical protein ACE5JN_07375 [Candidatus Methylomirabilia bacterium]
MTIRLPDDEYKALDQICEREGYAKVRLMRSLIRRFVEERSNSPTEGKELERRVREAMASGFLLRLAKRRPKATRPVQIKGKAVSRVVLEDRG